MTDHTLTISDDRKTLILKTTYEARYYAKAVPGAIWDKDNKVWLYPARASVVNTLMGEYSSVKMGSWGKPGLEMDSAVESWYRKTCRDFEESQALKIRDDLPEIPITKYPAWNHQLQAYHFCRQMKASFLHMHMGTGKTKVCIDLILNRGHQKILILCPKSVIPVWISECKKHAPIGFDVPACAITGTRKQKSKILVDGGYPIYVTNFESLLSLDLRKLLKEMNFDLCIVDESHRIKSSNGKISKFIATLGKDIEYKMCLTGTPMPKNPLDIYAQFRFLDPGIFGTSWVRFRDRYSHVDHFNQPYAYQNLDELRRKMDSITYHAGPDVLDLPEMTEQTRYYNLEPRAYKQYYDMMDGFFLQLADKESETTTGMAAIAMMKGQQITGGFIKDDNDKIQDLHDGKINLLLDTLEDIGSDEPIVIFCRFKQDILKIKAAFKEPVSCLFSEENTVSEWQAGDTRILIAQIQAGSVGIDLTRAAYAIYYTVDFNWGNYEQSRARIHRPGQTRPCMLIHFEALGPDNQKTIDSQILECLKTREDFIQNVLAGKINQG